MTNIDIQKLAVDGLWEKSINMDWQDLFSNSVEYGEAGQVEIILPHPDENVLDDYWYDWADHCESLEDGLAEFEEQTIGVETGYDQWTDSLHPVMNYAYPVDLRYGAGPREVATKIQELAGCVTLIEIDGKHYLALTGGGMDLSPQICMAYIACGVMPPLQFLRDLPRFAGSKTAPILLQAMERASEVLRFSADQLDQHKTTLEEWEG